jgi:hypothetical protein
MGGEIFPVIVGDLNGGIVAVLPPKLYPHHLVELDDFENHMSGSQQSRGFRGVLSIAGDSNSLIQPPKILNEHQ